MRRGQAGAFAALLIHSLAGPAANAATAGQASAPAQAGGAAACRHEVAGGGFTFDPGLNYLHNDGVVVHGFVDVRDRPLLHGVDLSKYQQDVDLLAARQCGARFAFVRLSAGLLESNEPYYRTNWASVRAAGLVPGGYHTLTLPNRVAALAFAGTTGDERQRLLAKARANGQAQAALFLSHLSELASLDPEVVPGAPVEATETLIPALALTADPLAKNSPDDQGRIADLYSATVCGFMDAMTTDPATPGRRLVVFTSRDTYLRYRLADAPCLASAMLWLRHRPLDAAPPPDPGVPSYAPVDATVADICRSAAGRMRCVFDQYTSNGAFAKFEATSAIDLDRFLGDEKAFLSLIVRRER